MTTLELKIYPDPILREACSPVEDFNEQLAVFLDNMAQTMYLESGIGLAAPQVGLAERVTVIDVSDNRSSIIELINPEITYQEGSLSSEEGCLSIPGYRDTVTRSKKIVVEAQDRFGTRFELEADDLLAICIQHEIDHLDGVLFIDHISRLKREIFKRRYKKLMAAEG